MKARGYTLPSKDNPFFLVGLHLQCPHSCACITVICGHHHRPHPQQSILLLKTLQRPPVEPYRVFTMAYKAPMTLLTSLSHLRLTVPQPR